MQGPISPSKGCGALSFDRICSFIKIADHRISERVDSELNAGAFWPEPLLQLNPTFLPGGTIDELVAQGTLHPECAKIFRIDKSDTDQPGSSYPPHPSAGGNPQSEGGQVLRANQRHGVGQEPDLHRADR